DNLYLGAVNAFTGEAGKGKNQLTGAEQSFPDIARYYKSQAKGWVVFGDENYGEGSSREHAAMEPRHLGGVAVIARSFARIAETNLKKQGMLPLVFVKAADYDKVQEDDRVDIRGLGQFAPNKNLTVVLTHKDGSTDSFEVAHSFNDEQIGWFKAGSALNKIAMAA
ncbi:MAG: aconitate hydratase, partial [Myxococcota bacterium]